VPDCRSRPDRPALASATRLPAAPRTRQVARSRPTYS
jgi:hypothetical protein